MHSMHVCNVKTLEAAKIMAFLSFLDTNLAFFDLGAYNLKFSSWAIGCDLICVVRLYYVDDKSGMLLAG